MVLPAWVSAVLDVLLAIGAIAILVPSAILFLECALALLPPRQGGSVGARATRRAVLVPAHDESAGIRPTLEQIAAQLQPGDRLLVVADNCTDDTAAVARAAGAEVLERQDPDRRGKGYALDFGLNHLAADPPEVVALVDADCDLGDRALDRLFTLAAASDRPVQAVYLMEPPPNPSPKDAVSAFAFKVKNLVRPRGLDRLGMPCLLTGTGMAFPWAVLRSADLASGNIVEDMKLGLDLAVAGAPPRLCSAARVVGRLPQQASAATSQRTRWEHGHLQTLTREGPRLLAAGLRQGRLDLLALALDLCVPPLSLLVLLWAGMTAIAVGAGAIGASWLPAGAIAIAGGLLAAAIFLAWGRFGRQDLPLGTLLSVPLYVLWKIPLYFKFFAKPQQGWVRTARDPQAVSPPSAAVGASGMDAPEGSDGPARD